MEIRTPLRTERPRPEGLPERGGREDVMETVASDETLVAIARLAEGDVSEGDGASGNA